MIMIKEKELRLLSKVPLIDDIEPFETIKKGRFVLRVPLRPDYKNKFILRMFCVSYIVSKFLRFADPDEQRRVADLLTARIYKVCGDSVDVECQDYTLQFIYKDGKSMSDITGDEIRAITLDAVIGAVERVETC